MFIRNLFKWFINRNVSYTIFIIVKLIKANEKNSNTYRLITRICSTMPILLEYFYIESSACFTIVGKVVWIYYEAVVSSFYSKLPGVSPVQQELYPDVPFPMYEYIVTCFYQVI